jgi:predicted RNase H-related nuclease YkuK (DUF458 family)
MILNMWLNARKAILDSSKQSSIYIGCDSLRVPKKNKALYSTVVVLHMDSKRGCKIFHNQKTVPDYGQMRPRLLMEVQYALEAFYAIEDIVGNRRLEVHLDVNPDPRHASNVVTNEALGWVRGLGIQARIKPDSFAATTAADHFVRH